MTKIWEHLFQQELKIQPENYKFLITDCPKNDRKDREELTELFFEKFMVPKLYIQIQAVLSLYASGKTTGTVVDCGDGISHTVPIYEGFAIPHAIKQSPIAGRHLNDRLL